MNEDSVRVWQVAAGDTDRSYQDLCLRLGIICFGPGRKGPWPQCEERLRDNWDPKKIGLIKTFHESIQKNDVIILRLGTRHVYGVGQVADESACWNDHFGDVDGWDLQFVRRVRWLWNYRRDNKKVMADGEHRAIPEPFPAYAMKWGPTIQPLSEKSPVRSWALGLEAWERYGEEILELEPLPDLPDTGEEFIERVPISNSLLKNHS